MTNDEIHQILGEGIASLWGELPRFDYVLEFNLIKKYAVYPISQITVYSIYR